jgi:hypothetical protein
MTKTLKIILIFIISIFSLHKVAAKTPADASIYSIGLAFKLFKNKHGEKLPGSWDECIESGLLNEPLLSEARRFCDLENRYFFPDLSIPLTSRSGTIKIIVMANKAGGEGNSVSSHTGDERTTIAGRFLIVENERGEIRASRYSEKEIERMFRNAGLDLTEYTHDAPELPTVIKPENFKLNPLHTSEVSREIKKKSTVLKEMYGISKINKDSQTRFSNYYINIIILFSLIIFFILTYFLRKFLTAKSRVQFRKDN